MPKKITLVPVKDPDAPKPAPRKRHPQDVKVSAEEIRAEIERLSRGPFQEALSIALAGAPDVAAMAALGIKSPDRWAQAVIMLAKLAGYREGIDVNANITARVSDMSDTELQQRLEALHNELVGGAHKVEE